ncbi:MAG: hypothetical protein AB7N65_12750 [Vicinamibacterales bacterium]
MQAKSMIVATVLTGALSATGFAQTTPQTANPASPGQSGQTQTGTADGANADRNAQTTVTGCLEKNKSGGFWLTKAMPAAESTSGAAGTSGTAGAAGTAATAGTAGNAVSPKGMVYNLEEIDGRVGNLDLDKHVGHKIEVTGRVDDTKSSDKPKSATSAAGAGDQEIDAQDFHISSVKMVAASCQ